MNGQEIGPSQEDSKRVSPKEVSETNSPEPVIKHTEPSTITEQVSTKQMEVHHHPHVEKKASKNIFWNS